jgi:hypothetical protein
LLSRNRFDQILRSLHFRDNSLMSNPEPDKFFKVRPLFEHINDKIKIFSSGECVSIDESMVVYFGFHGAKQYIKR